MAALNYDDAHYVGLVAAALIAGQIPAVLRTDCPSCGNDRVDPATHVIIDGDVVLACDGYRVIDPNAVGLSDPAWKPSGE